jgi:cell division protein ZapE
MSLTERYKSALQQPDRVHDAAQEQAIIKLEALTTALTTNDEPPLLRFLKNLSPFAQHQKKPPQGLYLWGDVGRGKTWLMNLFYEELPIKKKSRIHFHHFMLSIHEQLAELNRGKGKKQKNPVRTIAKQLARDNQVLCIDEFIVTNITDAMILSELLRTLFKHQVCLVATSNRIPDDLYLNGLQRERFLPSIELIKRHTEVFQLEVTPIIEQKTLSILNREVITIKCCEEIVWLDFEIICSAPRAAQDYIELAQQFSTVILSGIPIMDEYSDDRTRRFIYLIDELYDRNVKLIAKTDR